MYVVERVVYVLAKGRLGDTPTTPSPLDLHAFNHWNPFTPSLSLLPSPLAAVVLSVSKYLYLLLMRGCLCTTLVFSLCRGGGGGWRWLLRGRLIWRNETLAEGGCGSRVITWRISLARLRLSPSTIQQLSDWAGIVWAADVRRRWP